MKTHAIRMALVAVAAGCLSACHAPHAPHDLPTYGADSPEIDNENWSATQSQAEWKERPGLNEAALHEIVTGRHHPYHGF